MLKKLTKTVDYEEYAFHQDFFYGVCQDFNCTPMVDLFANNANKKVDKFFSLTYCPNTIWVLMHLIMTGVKMV